MTYHERHLLQHIAHSAVCPVCNPGLYPGQKVPAWTVEKHRRDRARKAKAERTAR